MCGVSHFVFGGKKNQNLPKFQRNATVFPFQHPIIHWYSNICNTISAAHHIRYVTSSQKKCSNSSSESRDIYVYVLDRYIMFITTYEHNAAHCLQKSFHLIYLSFFLFLLPFLSLSLYLYPSHPLPLRRRSSSTIHTHTHTHIQI